MTFSSNSHSLQIYEDIMTLQNLLKVLPTPTNPIEIVDDSQWKTYELVTGITLPDDYKAYLSVFGTGIIGYVITPYNPFCTRPLWKVRYSCRKWMQEATAIVQFKQQFGAETFPYMLYPETDGVLPWGSTDNGDRLYWLTTGSPNEWSVVINEVRSSIFEHFACSMTDFLYKLIVGDIQSEIIPHDCLDQDSLFETL